MKALYLLSLIVLLGIAGYVNSAVCKCGNSISSTCCSHNKNCYKKSFFNPHHCDVQNRVDSSLCSKTTSFCRNSSSLMTGFATINTTNSTNQTTNATQNSSMCKCGHFEYSYSCCQSSDSCHSSFFVQHCPVQKRVIGCVTTTQTCGSKSNGFDSMYTAMINSAPAIEEFGVCKCGLTNAAYSCCSADNLCQVSFWKGHHCDTKNRVGSNQCVSSTPFCSNSVVDEKFNQKLHVMNEMAQNDEWIFENQEKAIEKK